MLADVLVGAVSREVPARVVLVDRVGGILGKLMRRCYGRRMSRAGRWHRDKGTDLLACVGWLVGGVRVFLFVFDRPTGLPSGPFCLLFVDADMSMRPEYMRGARSLLLTDNWL
jgi:hypothetical protein